MRRGRLPGAIVALAVLACAAAPAGAEPVLDLGQGVDPSAVTDAAGTLHVVWRDLTLFQRPLRYCRVPAGANACTPVDITHDRDARGKPHLLLRPQDGALIVVFGGSDPTLDEVTKVMYSLDGGATWSAPAPVGAGLPDVDDAELSPDGAFVDTVGEGDLDHMLFQRVPLAGGVEGRIVDLGREQYGRHARVLHLPDGRPVVVAHFAERRLGTRVAAPGADPNVAGAWSPPTSWSNVTSAYSPDADVGPTGAWMLGYTAPRSRTVGTFAVRIWRWGARGFAHPRSIGALARRAGAELGQTEETIGSRVALDVDLAGRLHAAWPLLPRNCGGVLCIVYRRTDRRGFGPPIVYPVGTGPGDTVERFGLAANSGGSGWLVWGSHSNRIRAVPLVTPPLGSRVGSRRIGRRRVTIPDFYGCVPSGGTFVHRLEVDGRRGARILSVRFFFDAGVPARTDHRAPYRLRFRLMFPPGTRHVAGAIVRYRLADGRLRSARIGRTFVMC
jgi:hypothetical protein